MENKIGSTRAFIRARYIKKDFLEKFRKVKKRIICKNKKNVYIFLAADYGNLGDIAITYSQRKLINKCFKDEYEILEIPLAKTYEYIDRLSLKKDDIITIVGGGNISDRYEWIEEARRQVIKKFRKNKIVSFPQTFEFSNTNLGMESLRRTINIYNKNKNLYIFAREENSYKSIVKYLKNENVFLAPDIVFFLKNSIKSISSNDEIGFCFRNDSEKIFTQEEQNEMYNIFKNYNIIEFDTHIGDENVIYEDRYKVLEEFIEKVGKMKLIITDRLHGMIFSYITNTPCIAFDNANHKISSTYNTWLKGCDSILLMNNLNKDAIVEFLEKIENKNIIDNSIKFNYNELEEILKKQQENL